MADKTKQDYYQNNKEKRLAYQREYYKKNRDAIRRKRELKLEGDPGWADHQKEYNRKYYVENKARIKAKRAVSRKRAAQTKRDTLNK